MKKGRLLLLAAIVLLVALYIVLDLGRYLTLDFFKSQQATIDSYVGTHFASSALLFFLAYVAVTGLSLPGAAIMTLAAGAIFGLVWGTVIVSFASTIGATVAFLASRFLFHDLIQGRFGDKLKAVNAGIERDGAFYLFTLRLVPAFPFFVINLLMALTPIKTRTFYWVSQVGMLAGTIVYVNAGTQVAKIESLRGILSPALIISFTLLGVFPFLARWMIHFIKSRRLLAKWRRPRSFDRNLVVIGAGSAGLVSAFIAAMVKAKVTLIEKNKMGGDCLNTGCVPSKALIRSARVLATIRRARELGLKSATAECDFAEVMDRVKRVVRTIEPHDSIERYTTLGVECIAGDAKITSPWTVEVKTSAGVRTLTTRAVVIAAGARPFVPPIPGIDQIDILTSDNVWELRSLPKRLLVLGGGPIGCELAQCFARLGSHVTQVEMLPRVMIREDPEFSAMVTQQFREEGIEVLAGHKAAQFVIEGGEKILICEHNGRKVRVAFDALLCAVGRVANTDGYGLEELGIPRTATRTVQVDEFMRTIYPNIYACGDVAGPYQFTHTAAHTAWYATVNALFGGFRKFRADFSVIPWATFTDPEIARVGLNETEAAEKGIPYEVTTYDIADLDRAIADENARGKVKVLTVPGKDKILGATIAGEHAGDLIIEFILALRHGIGLNKILGTIHVYPTLAEANKYTAGAWKRMHVSQNLLRWVEKFHGWMRG